MHSSFLHSKRASFTKIRYDVTYSRALCVSSFGSVAAESTFAAIQTRSIAEKWIQYEEKCCSRQNYRSECTLECPWQGCLCCCNRDVRDDDCRQGIVKFVTHMRVMGMRDICTSFARDCHASALLMFQTHNSAVKIATRKEMCCCESVLRVWPWYSCALSQSLSCVGRATVWIISRCSFLAIRWVTQNVIKTFADNALLLQKDKEQPTAHHHYCRSFCILIRVPWILSLWAQI